MLSYTENVESLKMQSHYLSSRISFNGIIIQHFGKIPLFAFLANLASEKPLAWFCSNSNIMFIPYRNMVEIKENHD